MTVQASLLSMQKKKKKRKIVLLFYCSRLSSCSFCNGSWTSMEASLRETDDIVWAGCGEGRGQCARKAICETYLPLSITLSFEDGGRGWSAIWKFFRLSAMWELLRWHLSSVAKLWGFKIHLWSLVLLSYPGQPFSCYDEWLLSMMSDSHARLNNALREILSHEPEKGVPCLSVSRWNGHFCKRCDCHDP